MAQPSRPSARQRSSSAPDRTPVRLGAKALVVEAGRVLLVEERHADGSTFWTLPGGGLWPGETVAEGLRRELDEELNCRLAFDEEVGRFWYAHASGEHTLTRYTVITARAVTDVTPSPREGILDVGWFAPAKCPTTTLPQVRFLLQGEVGSQSNRRRPEPRSTSTVVSPETPGRSGP